MKLKKIPKIFFASRDEFGREVECHHCGTPFGEATVEDIRGDDSGYPGVVRCPKCGLGKAALYWRDMPECDVSPILASVSMKGRGGDRVAILLDDGWVEIVPTSWWGGENTLIKHY